MRSLLKKCFLDTLLRIISGAICYMLLVQTVF